MVGVLYSPQLKAASSGELHTELGEISVFF